MINANNWRNITKDTVRLMQDLRAFAVQPVFVHPTHYTSDDGYFTDTEWADSAPLMLDPLTKDEL